MKRKKHRNLHGEQILFRATGTEAVPSAQEVLAKLGYSRQSIDQKDQMGQVDEDEDFFAPQAIKSSKEHKKAKKSQPPEPKEPKRGRNVGSEPGQRETVGLRIVGGTCRGRQLTYTGDNRVRPMKERVREAVFNLIGPAVRNKFVIDLFAGTGALALEALSRGATQALLLELHLPTSKNAKRNAEAIGLADRCTFLTTDSFYWSKTRTRLDTELPWLVFCSPPYDFFVDHRAGDMVTLITDLVEAAPDESIFVIESDNRFDFRTLPFEIPEKRRRTYAPAEIGIYTKIEK